MELEIRKDDKRYEIRQVGDAGARNGSYENFYYEEDLGKARQKAAGLSEEARSKNKKLVVRTTEYL